MDPDRFLSPKAKLLFDEVRGLIDFDVELAEVLPYRFTIGHPAYNITVSSETEFIADFLRARYYGSLNCDLQDDLKIHCLNFSLSKYLLVTRDTIILVEAEGDHKIFLGQLNKRSLQVFAGSIGDYDKKHQHHQSSLLTFIDNQIISLLLKSKKDLIVVHANLLIKNNTVVILIGDSGSGKTTTSYNLSTHGFDLFSDDFIFIDRNSGFIYPGPKKPKINEDYDSSFKYAPLGNLKKITEMKTLVFFLEKGTEHNNITNLDVMTAAQKFVDYSSSLDESDLFKQIRFSFSLLSSFENYQITFDDYNSIKKNIIQIITKA